MHAYTDICIIYVYVYIHLCTIYTGVFLHAYVDIAVVCKIDVSWGLGTMCILLGYLSSVFWRLNPVRLSSLYKILYPEGRIESYSILGTIVSPNKILHK